MNRRLAVTCALVTLVSAGPLTAQGTTGSQKRPAAAQHPERDAEHTIPAAQVPAAVRESFARAYPHATVLKYSTEREKGKTIYEVESREGSTRRDLDIGTDGTILETETQLPAAQLPAPVRTAAEANGAHIQVAELVVAGHDTTYEIKIQGRRGELKLRPDGRPAPSHD